MEELFTFKIEVIDNISKMIAEDARIDFNNITWPSLSQSGYTIVEY